MELNTGASAVHLPPEIDAASVAVLARDVERALEAEGRVLALVGAGDGVFCTGLALAGPPDAVARTSAFAAVLAMLHASPKPTLALVDGRCIGGGLGLAAACDWVIATEPSTFALPELLWGLMPAIIWPVVTDRMAPHVARQWTLTAWTRPAGEAAAAGLVDEVVPAGALDTSAGRALRMLGRIDPRALARLRGWARACRHQPLPEALAQGAGLTAEMLRDPAVRARRDAYAAGEAPWSL